MTARERRTHPDRVLDQRVRYGPARKLPPGAGMGGDGMELFGLAVKVSPPPGS